MKTAEDVKPTLIDLALKELDKDIFDATLSTGPELATRLPLAIAIQTLRHLNNINGNVVDVETAIDKLDR